MIQLLLRKAITYLQRSCNLDIHEICNWYVSNKMAINTKKSHYLLCNASASNKFSLKISGSELERHSKSKLFGYQICDSLAWTDHVEFIAKKVRSNLALFQKM